MTDFQATLQFLLIMMLVGISGFPLSRLIFHRLPDHGWAFSKTLSTLVCAWALWMLASLKLIPINSFTAWTTLILYGCVNWGAVFLCRRRIQTLRFDFNFSTISISTMTKWVAVEILAYTIIFCTWTYFRGFSPNISGLEKFMDFGFMNSVLRGGVIPPMNHFLGGETINYYYYGHYIAAFNTLLSKVPASMGYNLQMSHLVALSFTHAFILSGFILKMLFEKNRVPESLVMFGGLLSGVFVNFVGNFQAVYQRLSEPGKSYWYPNATRYIEATIHEFPLYSFLVNDLHGHVANIPNAMICICLGVLVFLETHATPFLKTNGLSSHLQEWPWKNPRHNLFVALSFCIGSGYLTNAWDFPIYLFLSGTFIWVAHASRGDHGESPLTAKLFSIRLLGATLMDCAFLLVLSILWFLPHWLEFSPISKGILPVPAPKSSPLMQLVILWVIHLTPSFLIYRRLRKVESEFSLATRSVLGVWILVLGLLIIFPELFYMKDIYPGHPRANTMFKFFYQAWIWSGIIAGVAYIYLIEMYRSSGSPRKEMAMVALMTVSLAAGFYYTSYGINQHFLGFEAKRSSIEGLEFLAERMPGDLKAISWINSNIHGQPTIAEAVGDSYTDYARISTFTGLPTVIGWPVHVWLWNGGYDQSLSPTTKVEMKTQIKDSVSSRVHDIKTLYETPDESLAHGILQKYEIKYIYVGDLERKKYLALVEQKFATLGKVIYENEGTRIYQVVK